MSTLTNSIMMCSINHPFMYICMLNSERNMNNFSSFGKHLHVLTSTGPHYK